MKTALVLGSSGFIGGHLVKRLKDEGYWVRGVDIEYPKYTAPDDFIAGDLRNPRVVETVMIDHYQEPFKKGKTFDEVYQLAALMGGAGYIFTGEHDADIMHSSALININVAAWAKIYNVPKLFYSSSACMYPHHIQNDTNNPGLKESDAYPALPDSEYGWEKLFSERLYLAYQRNYNLNVRIARFHNIYGPEGTYEGGREKAPAAMCRKAIEAEMSFTIWGDGNQTRSFLYIDDCIDAVRLLMQSDFKEPINIGSEEMVTIRELAQMAINLSGKNLYLDYDTSKNLGVRGRNSNNDLIRKVLKWEPKFSLKQGLELTYKWIEQQYV